MAEAAYLEQPRLTSASGLNLISSPDALPETAFPDLGNVRISAGARIATRRGATATSFPALYTTLTAAWLEAYAVEDTGYKTNHATSQLVFVNGACFRSITDTSGVTTIGAPLYTYGTVGLARLRRPFAANFSDTVAVANKVTPFVVAVFGHTQPRAVNSLTDAVTTISHTDWVNSYPTAVASYGGRVWYAASDDFPARLWATDVGAVGTFTVNTTPQPNDSFYLDLDLVDGGRIIGMQHLFDILLVFTTHGVYRISPQSGATIPYKSNFLSTHACYSQHAIVKVDNGVVFLSQSGIHSAVAALTYGDVQFNDLSPALAPVFDSMEAWQLAGAFITYDPVANRILVFVDHNHAFARKSSLAPLYTTTMANADMAAVGFAYSPGTTECFVYDLRGKSWTRDFFPYYVRYAVNRAEPGGKRVTDAYDFDTLGGTINLTEYALEDAAAVDDAGSPLVSYVRTKEETFGSLARKKHHIFIEADGVSGTPVVNASFDRAAFVQAGTMAAGNNRFPLRGSGRRVQAEWYASGSSFELAGYSFDVGRGGRR